MQPARTATTPPALLCATTSATPTTSHRRQWRLLSVQSPRQTEVPRAPRFFAKSGGRHWDQSVCRDRRRRSLARAARPRPRARRRLPSARVARLARREGTLFAEDAVAWDRTTSTCARGTTSRADASICETEAATRRFFSRTNGFPRAAGSCSHRLPAWCVHDVLDLLADWQVASRRGRSCGGPRSPVARCRSHRAGRALFSCRAHESMAGTQVPLKARQRAILLYGEAQGLMRDARARLE